MKICFLGTGAAEGVPAIFCTCQTCQTTRKRGGKELHFRAQFLIDDTLGIDFPPDAYAHSVQFGVDLTKMNHLLITHSHCDHFYAHDFILRGYKYTKTPLDTLHIYGNEEVEKVFKECTRRELREEVASLIKVHVVKPFQSFMVGGGEEYEVTALPAQHSKKEDAYVYLIKKGKIYYLHLTDSGRLPKETIAYLTEYFSRRMEKVNFVTFDCTFLFTTAGETSRHMGLEDNAVMRKTFLDNEIVNGNTKYAVTHYSHNNNPLSETLKQAEEKYGVIATYDGFTVEI